MTFGRPEWNRCKKKATVMIKFRQRKEKVLTLPGCAECWQRCIDSEDIKIIFAGPIGQCDHKTRLQDGGEHENGT